MSLLREIGVAARCEQTWDVSICRTSREHSFSYNWEAMRGYHFLMQIAHLLNTLVQNSAGLVHLVRNRGLRGLLQFLRSTCSGPWLDAERIRQLQASPCQIRLE